MSSSSSAAPVRQRALVVEPDSDLRQRLSLLLSDHGLDVASCDCVERGRELFADQRLVVAPLNGDNTAMKEFVAWVRAEAGVSQPWIIAFGESHKLAPGETPAQYGVNDLFTGPMDTGTLVNRLELIGLCHSRQPSPVPPSYHRARQTAGTPPSWDGASARVLLEHFPAAVAILDRSMTYLAVNDRWTMEFQIPAGSLSGRCHYEIFPDLHPDWRGLYDRCLAGDKKQAFDDTLPRPDGTEALVHWDIQPWHDASGGVGGLVLTCAELHGEGAAVPEPPAVEKSGNPGEAPDEAFREMAEAAPFGMVLLDEDAHVLYANPQHRCVLGFPAETGAPVEHWLQRACGGDEVFRKRALDEWWETVWRRHNALTCSFRTAEGLVKDIEFRPAGLSGDRVLLTIFDVTDARLDEQAVRASEARYRGLFQHASSGLLVINSAGNITEINPAFEALTGLPRQEARRASLTEFLPADAVSRLRSLSLISGQSPGFITELHARGGPATPVHLSAAVIRNGQGQTAFTACLLTPLPDSAASSTASAHPWESITPDWLLLLDGDGTILAHTAPRDFAPYRDVPGLTGQDLETALPAVTAPLPLDVMMERLLDSPGHETRCEYSVEWPGEESPHRVEARLNLLPGGPPHRFGLTLRDLTRARSSSDPGGFNVAVLRHLSTAAILTNERGRILHLNPAAEALTGYDSANLDDAGLFRLLRPDAPREFSEILTRQLQTHRSWHTLTPLTRRDQTTVDCHAELTPAQDSSSGNRGFILLLRPVDHPGSPVDARPAISLHRARNDLQVLTSLMALQADHIADPAAQAELVASRDRLAAVALIYRMVQHEEDPVDFSRFATELGRGVLESHHRAGRGITIEVGFDGILIPQRLAVNLGLILEELLTGCLIWSYAEAEATGIIQLNLTASGGEGMLILRDNGQPLSEERKSARESTFSHRLVQLLSGQIGGAVSYLSGRENQVRLRFRLPETELASEPEPLL